MGRQFSAKEVQGLQSLQQQLRLYVAKLRTMLVPYRKQARPHALLCALFLTAHLMLSIQGSLLALL